MNFVLGKIANKLDEYSCFVEFTRLEGDLY